ncbi:MAG: cytochrome-c oxidase, cbb3-type subunit III [Geminicoccaceae bacterium]|nr:cytochrome-c oxidase, cbb3-type subunit III [Geminicoccaceae bacterium]MCS7267051.1 cytochrome-c oxidase, cbb3-type subunit III [Geminicoccaceae bacterium]MDW8125431.1 cytochrome-c oxidase, cbb3-type subunit III [Geminicoccaceae bacterium]MDW8342247.1 cytochrome-c oxidase, cbb3-type subunit III [Geminicoccaceae bacterium]
MPAKIEKDELSGMETTGHEWDGIKELNTPLPKWWVYLFYATILFSIAWWILYPAWPSLTGYTKGVLGSNQRLEVEERLAEGRARQQKWLEQIAAKSPAEIRADPELLRFATVGGQAAFATNCAPCHAAGGAGQGFFPALVDDEWIWGGTLEDIEYSIRHGIRNVDDPQARASVMPAFGADGILDRAQIRDVTQFVLQWSGRATDQAAVARGAALYAEHCASCHGENGEGMTALGAPRLSDAIWLYGGKVEQIEAQIWRPRHGVMPPWQGRLSDETIKMLTVYVHGLGGGQ